MASADLECDPLLLGAAREMGHRGMGRLDYPDTSLDYGPRLQAPPSFCVWSIIARRLSSIAC